MTGEHSPVNACQLDIWLLDGPSEGWSQGELLSGINCASGVDVAVPYAPASG
jgi:hypothetical protein